ncbi:MAG: GIY-YIG nuclease family protein [Lachnospiraceae bacterium]|nr:GIY-YIG nuclease family protein [Lachnospiraceae bacterium]
MQEQQIYTYMVRCRDGSLYTGWTNCIEKRIQQHNAGMGAKYTRARRPVELVYLEKAETKQEAMSREYHYKRLSREEKEQLLLSKSNCLTTGGMKSNSECRKEEIYGNNQI